jgi:hypothetical protein
MPLNWDMYHIFYFPSERRHAEDSYHKRKKSTTSAGIEPANSRSSCQYANHYTIEAVICCVRRSKSEEFAFLNLSRFRSCLLLHLLGYI